MRILLIEPDEYYHAQFANHLADIAELAVASNLSDARELIAEMTPDVIVLELLLQDEPAYKLLEEMSQDRHSAPRIIFSKIYNPEDIRAAMNLGASGYFVKGRDTIHDIKKLLLTYQK